jgi:hypothetical protein
VRGGERGETGQEDKRVKERSEERSHERREREIIRGTRAKRKYEKRQRRASERGSYLTWSENNKNVDTIKAPRQSHHHLSAQRLCTATKPPSPFGATKPPSPFGAASTKPPSPFGAASLHRNKATVTFRRSVSAPQQSHHHLSAQRLCAMKYNAV